MKPAVSVIVPVFSRADTIGRALESVLSQTFSDYEIVVVDDGSTDDTCRIIEQIQTDRLTLIRHASNRGPAAARNTAINASRGRWIAFLDSDDAWRPEKLERQVAILDKAAANIAACATGFCLHRDGRAFEVNQDIPPDRFRRDILFGCTISPGSTLMVDRAAFDKIGLFDEQMLRLEDWDWLLRFSEQFNIAFDPAPLADIYQADPTGRNSSGDPDAVFDAIRRIEEKHLPRLPLAARKRQLRSSLLVESAGVYYRRGQSLRAAGCVLASFLFFPMRNAAFFSMLWRSGTSVLRPRRP